MSDRSPSAQDLEVCQRTLKEGSKSFHAASLLLPRRLRGPVAGLYAFCREADDAVDEAEDPAEGAREVRARLEAIYAPGARLEDPVDRAFAYVVSRYGVPREAPEALLEGLEWDAAGRRYETLSDVVSYGVRVASSVGMMMTLVMGPRAPLVLARACELGVAMQLTNISRDVGEDARMGRCYLPAEWLREEGIEVDDWLEAPYFSPALGRVVKRLLGEARRLYRVAAPGIRWLPADCQVSISAASAIYEDIGQVIEARGYDSVASRAYVLGARKLALAVGAMGVRFEAREVLEAPPLEEARFLIEGVER